MKKKLIFLFIILLCSIYSYSQSGWFVQNVGTTSHLHSIHFPSLTTGYIVGWASKILKTTNSGNNWFNVNNPYSIDAQCVYFVNNDTGWISGGLGIIEYTTNGGNNWVSQSSGFSGHLYSIAFINSSTGIMVGDGGKIIKTTNGGGIWTSKNSGTSYNLTSIVLLDANTGFISGDYGTLLKTTSAGESWFSQNPGITNNLGKIFFVNSTTGWMSGTNGIILKTTNGGNGWTIQISGTSAWIMTSYFVSPSTGWISGVSGIILKTTNGGDNWFSQTSNTSNEFRCNFFLNASTGFSVGFYGTVIKTTNGGVSAPVAPVLIYPANASIINTTTPNFDWNNSADATSYHIQVSSISNFSTLTDSATVINSNYLIPAGKLQNNASYFWRVKAKSSVGESSWSSVWYFSVLITNIIKLNDIIPDSYNIYQNYPNPFNPNTKIKFDIPQKSYTSVNIYDITGKKIQSIVNGELSAGTYEYSWNASAYNSGIYFVKFVSNSKNKTLKVLLIK